ncbi:MAG: 3-methyl-2-oxobutanoate hydroxymethyltransferase [Gammaproteobacteria bacterium]|nr:MAG: 3-methyl-2-oxobutanoate hydroxymethyltransferase [Gammaproteobacteria bacterium]
MGLPITIKKLKEKKQNGEKFTMLTAYDATLAMLCEKAGVDMILVGDSLGMVIQGHDTTVPVSVDDMVYHAKAVARGAPNTVKMVDMPFMSFAYPSQAIDNAARLMQEGHAEIIKIESTVHQTQLITELSRNGVPVCAHLGLTPQTIHKLGSYGKRGKDAAEAQQILSDAKELEQSGADMLLLECVPDQLAKAVTEAVDVPVIGIGAGRAVDAQVLVIYDILGMSGYIPSFAKNFLAETDSIENAIRKYVADVKNGVFPV